VSASLPVKSIDELVAYAKSHPEPLAYGSNGVGTTQHLAAVLFSLRTGIRLNHVPYKGVDGLMPDLVANRIQLSFNNVASSLPHLKSGALRALAMGLPKRWPGLPDVPTFAEVGLADFDVSSWVGLFGPAGLPAPVVARLERAAVEALARPDMRQKIVTGGNDPVGGTAPELAKFLESEIEHWRRAIEAAGARPE
jgi:tripartite-type tricarboxylate transporter receptor subunit TctC